MKQKAECKNYISGLAALLAAGIFAVCVLSVLLVGTDAYNGLAERDSQAYQTRTCTQFLATKVRQASDGDLIHVGSFGGSDALVIDETIDGEEYKTFIYCYDGWLREYFTDAEAVDPDLDAEFGSRLVPAEALDLKLEGTLLHAEVTLKEKTVSMVLFLRSKEEGVHEE